MVFPRGKVTAIMGGSGCGKTTILRLIGGQIKPKAGQVSVDGKIVHKQDRQGIYELRRKMGMLFQHGALFTDLSVFDNVAFPIREHTKLPESMIRDLVLMKLNAVGLRGAHKLMSTELSGGMARRVALARAIALDPDIIMYDEPFAGLDPISMAVICDLIRTLNDALGATSIIVTHDVEEAFLLQTIFILLQMELSLQKVHRKNYQNLNCPLCINLFMAKKMVPSHSITMHLVTKKIFMSLFSHEPNF